MLKAILETLDEGIVALAPSGETFANKLFIEMFGAGPPGQAPAMFTLAEALKKYTVIDEAGNELGPEERPMARVLRGEHIPESLAEIRFSHGGSFMATYRGQPVFAEDGSVVLAIIAARDITAQLELAEQLADAKERAGQLAKSTALQSLALALAHELSQPLSTALSRLASIKILAEAGDISSIKAHVDQSMESILRTSDIIRSFRSRLKKAPHEKKVCLTTKLIHDAVAIVGNPRLDQLLSISISLEATEVVGDKTSLEQVLVNLLQNALSATSAVEDASVRIVVDTINPHFVRFQISDNGPGLEAGLIPNLFKPFNSPPDGNGRLGIGLSVCQSIIDEHDGKIWLAESARGATICFTLPSTLHAAV